MEVYVIQNLINNGYWCSERGEFKGWLYTTHYAGENEAIRQAILIANDNNIPLTIVEVIIPTY